VKRFSVILLNAGLFALAAWSQDPRGRIQGQITDSSGAVIPGAAVEIANVATGTATRVESNDQGNYQAPFLIPGIYRVSVEKTGFRSYVREGLEVRVDDRLEVNIALEIGQVGETITVSADAPLLDTTGSSLGQVIDARRVAELPIPHGVPFHLMKLAPGANLTGNAKLDQSYAPTHMVAYTMDGARSGRNDVTIDGVPNTSTADPNQVTSSYVPPSDVVAEFKVQTAPFDATVGQTEGGVVNVSLKSGTNEPHGTAYYWKKDPVFDANTFFGNRNGQPRGDFTYDRWGASATGPVWLPKLYNGRNRTFYMYGYEGIRTTEPRGNTLTVPTAKQREGDFSDLLALGANYQIYDPFTRRSIAGGRFQSDPLPGNIIPASRISPIAQKILSYYALPTTAGTADGGNNLPLPNHPETLTYYNHIARVDHNLSDRHRIFVRGAVYKRDSSYFDWFGNAATGEFFQFLSRSVSLDDVYTFTPTFFMNLRYGFNRFVRSIERNPAAQSFDLTSLGLPGSWNNAIAPEIRTFPYIVLNGYSSTFNGGLWRPTGIHTFVSAFEKVQGAHSFKFGLEYRLYQENQYNDTNTSTGRLDFGETYTRGPLDNSPASPRGQGLASLLLGIPTGGLVDRKSSYAEQSTVLALHFQDDWKLTRKLMLNLGLRYELEGPMTERFNRSVRGFDYNFVQPLERQVQANYARNPTPELPADRFLLRGGLTFPGVGGQPSALWERDKNNFMPRIGIAYQIQEKTVIRAGYGIFFGFLGTRRGDVNQIGFSQSTPLIASLDGGLTFHSTLANPFPDGIQEPTGSSGGPLTYVGRGISFFDSKPLAPYMQRWQFGIQRELPHRVLTELSYVGNRGTSIQTTRDLKAIPLEYLSTANVRDQERINYLSTNLPNPFFPLLPGTNLSGSLRSRSALLQPYPHFTELTTTTNEGYSWYHAMQARLEKRFSHGYTVQGSYTWSKFMEAIAFLNGADARPSEVISDQDFPHRFVMSGIYELPFGRGRPFLSGVTGAVDKFIGGWQVSAIFNKQSGTALGFGNVFFYGDVKNIPLPASQRTPERWFNVDAGFERNSARQPGSNVRTTPLRWSGVRADGMNSWDISLIKYVPINERIRLQFRGEFLNAFNHASFSPPNTTVTATTFGTITDTLIHPRRIQLGLKLTY
jgi:hypothetical protein